MHHTDLDLILLADAPEALVEVCGITLLERLLRVAQRLDFPRALVISATPAVIKGELARLSWPRDRIVVEIVGRPAGPITPEMLLGKDRSAGGTRCLVVPAALYCDARLLVALADKSSPFVLIDSQPPETARSLLEGMAQTGKGKLCGPSLLTRDFLTILAPARPLFDQLRERFDSGTIEGIDAATEPDYIVNMRRHMRPLCFPAPSRDQLKLAERIVLNTAQKGALDLPAYVHGVIENWVILRLCKTRVSPNQITLAGVAIGFSATVAFATGHVGIAIILALIFGVVDGLDGKQARTKVEMTERGQWEHKVDYVIENSWWAAIAFHLWRSMQLPGAFYLLGVLVAAHSLDAFVKQRAKKLTGRSMDDVGPLDRAFRLIGARRNIYVWMLALGICLGNLAQTYVAICGWAVITLLFHLLRFIWIGRTSHGARPDPRG
jgi:1L-myo-inositol 1-phosphate cytidylyltransferase / CDP-L-myo-inositol myo-inositolphosphotransferase